MVEDIFPCIPKQKIAGTKLQHEKSSLLFIMKEHAKTVLDVMDFLADEDNGSNLRQIAIQSVDTDTGFNVNKSVQSYTEDCYRTLRNVSELL